MRYTDFIILLPGLLGVATIVMLRVLDVLEDWYRGDGGHQRRYDAFIRDARRRGLSANETLAEFDLRSAFAKIRRLASDNYGRLGPDLMLDAIDEAVEEVSEELGRAKPHLVKPLHNWLASVTHADILYPEELVSYDAYLANLLRQSPELIDVDRFAALRIV